MKFFNFTTNQFIAIAYDERGRPILVVNHLGQSLDIDYEDAIHTINYTLADGQVVSDVYNTEHDFVKRSVKDSQGKIIFTRLGNERMDDDLLVQSPISTLTINNALAKLTLATGASYTRHYDDFGRVRMATDANTGKRHIRYDIFDRPTQILLDGTNQELSYHALGLPSVFKTCKTDNSQACQYTSYHYDTNGKLTKVEHRQAQDGKTSSIQYQYTDTGLIASQNTTLATNVNGNAHSQSYTTDYTYDDKDRIKSVTLPEGISLHYHYNPHSQVTQIDYQTPTSTLWQMLTGKYKALNKDDGNALLSNIQTDSTRGLLSLTHTNGSTVHQAYDDKARLTDKHDNRTQTKISHDKQTGQIVSIDDDGHIKTINEITHAYEYDANGNRVKHTPTTNQSNTHYTYEPNSDRLSVITQKDDKDNIITTTHYTYDNLGNPVMMTTKDNKGNTIKQRALDYTPDGQIKSIKGNDQLIATYQYNHLRQRIAKTVYDDKGAVKDTTQYLWDKGLLSAEIKDDKITRRYIYLDIMPVAVLDYTYQDNKGNVHDKPIHTKVYSVHTDHLGTPKAISDKDKNIVWQAELDTFGETKSIDSQNGFEFNLRFAGQYYDDETGYHYNYHRYYDPSIGRYLTSDPIGLMGGMNTYGYAYNRPWEGVDVWGLLSYNAITKHFTIDQGDTLQSIGKEFGISDVELARLNPQLFDNPKDISKFRPNAFISGAIIQAPSTKNIRAFKMAVSLIGSTKYAQSVKKGRFEEGTNKCNLFVYDVLRKSGFRSTPSRTVYGVFDMPVTAASLAEGNFPNSRIISIDEARIGDVMSWKVDYQNATGHTTIYTGKVNILWKDSKQDLSRKPHQHGTIGAGKYSVNYRRHDEAAMTDQGYTLDKAKIRRIDQ